jgi:hypothetical protein
MSIFRFLTRLILARAARREAWIDVDSMENHVVSNLGPHPSFDPVGNHEHARVARDLNRTSELEELSADLREQEDGRAGLISVFGGTVLLLTLYVIETLGCVSILRSLGFQNPERLLYGFGLATFILALTAAVVHHRRWWAFGLYGLLVLGVAIVRLGDIASEDGTVSEDLAGAVVLVSVTAGPAFLAELLFRRLSPAVRAWREIRKLRSRIRKLDKRQRRAQAYVERIGRSGEAWDREAERIRNIYQREQRRARAQRRQSNGDQSPAEGSNT